MKHSANSPQEYRVEINRLALGAMIKTPPDQDWHFSAAHAPPKDQLYAWLEYEYGRSSRFLRDQVVAVREETMRRKQLPSREVGEYPEGSLGCRFACLLARHTPEFPGRAWNTLASVRREELLVKLELDRWDTCGVQRVLRELDLDRFCNDCARGELFAEHLRSSNSEYHVVFKLDLGRGQTQINGAFAKWLQATCAKLDHGTTVKTGTRARSTTGQGFNRREVLAWMNRLVALRWGKHFSENWAECEARISGSRVKGVGYQNETSWVRAEHDAADLLQRFEFAWKLQWVGIANDVLRPAEFTHQPGSTFLARPLPWSKAIKGQPHKSRVKATALREYIHKQVQ